MPDQVCSPETTDVKAVWVDLPEKGPGTSQCGRAEDNDRGEGSKNEINNEMEKKMCVAGAGSEHDFNFSLDHVRY